MDEHSHVRGIITRRDLDAAAGRGAWRRNRMAPAPEMPDNKGGHPLSSLFSKSTWKSAHLLAGLAYYHVCHVACSDRQGCICSEAIVFLDMHFHVSGDIAFLHQTC